jgi:5-methylcytosine-specific restriction endonuclease McrA
MKVRREVPKYNKDGSRSKKDAVQYCCNACGQWTKSTAVAVDHITPVIDVQAGFVDWNQFVDRLFCDASNLQVICDTCHNAKTQGERIARLTLQYTEELNNLEYAINVANNHRNLFGATDGFKTTIKSLNKYIAKKKTFGL